ncbi:zinc-binding alcohol dehydrogenase [Agromyces sp. NPDC058484]|uniref:zinc-dependent alcohol dehydrogenase n=1 Tax=Agromyces sp. NPDC058484 TaxID=3346524 RepID=UPI00365EEC50
MVGAHVTFPRVATVAVVQEPDAPLADGQVRVRTLYSGISAGTELAGYRGTSPHLTRRWDPDLRLFFEGSAVPSFPVTDLGYEEVGEVVEVAGPHAGVALGDRVWGTWGHRSSAVLEATDAARRVLPDDVDPRIGIFSHIGAVALNAVIDADIHVGEIVAVFGLGVPGQLVAQLARLNGGRVVAVDGIAARCDLALRLGAEAALDSAEPVAERIRELSEGRGADVAIEISGSARALHEAIRSVSYNSRVVVAGFLQGDAVGLRLGEEFHHNRVQLVCSQISASAAAVSHRWDRYRLNATALRLASEGRLDVLSLISRTVTLSEIAEAYRALDQNPRDQLQVVIDFTS